MHHNLTVGVIELDQKFAGLLPAKSIPWSSQKYATNPGTFTRSLSGSGSSEMSRFCACSLNWCAAIPGARSYLGRCHALSEVVVRQAAAQPQRQTRVGIFLAETLLRPQRARRAGVPSQAALPASEPGYTRPG